MPTRRTFLRQSGLALVGSALLPSFLSRAARAAQEGGVTSRYGPDTTLVVIQMQGGNDGLNTANDPLNVFGRITFGPQKFSSDCRALRGVRFNEPGMEKPCR